MSQILKLIASILLFASIFTVPISSSAANTSSTSINKEPTSSIISPQSITISNGRKQLKKKLSLEYTHPKFETDLTIDQKEAILTTLKKWKGELPVDNIFTVTSIASLKTDTTDSNSRFKKSKKETSIIQFV
jgi:hypothetical protein